MAKSRSTRKTKPYTSSTRNTSSRSSGRKSVSRRSTNHLTLDQRLNFIGVVLAILGMLGLVAPFTDKNGPFTGWIALTIRQIAGWGGIILPLLLLAGGLTLLLRSFDRWPRVPGGRIVGSLLFYINLLTWFHFFTGGGFVTARLGKGGGFIGAGFDFFLKNSLGSAGEVVVLVAWFLIAVIFMINISLAELASRLLSLFKRDPLRKPVVQARQPVFRFSSSKNRSESSASLTDLPEGFRPLDTPANPTRAEFLRQRQVPQKATSISTTADTAAADLSTMPVVHIGVTKPSAPWKLPAVGDILDPVNIASVQTHYDKERVRKIEETLASFGAPAHVVEIHHGPTVTQFGVEPDFIETRNGRTRVRVAKIVALEHDLALVLAAKSIRIQAPVPGKAYLGIEVPNTELTIVTLHELLKTDAFTKSKAPLRFALGKDVAGKPICVDLASMPHLLVAGTTNSGKSVLVNAILTSLLLYNTPEDLRLVLVDPKRVELIGYNGIPHLLAPVVVEADRVVGALQWVLREMDSRYKRFSAAGARNIVDFNRKSGEHIPYLVIVIDELADLMMLAPDETERNITRLAQLARATGIHLIISVQRPSVDVLTGIIKANFPARVSFMVFSSTDSRVILDQPGADKLLGRGDMLYQAPDAPAPVRLQGVFVSDTEIQRLMETWKLIALNRSAEGGEAAPDFSLDMLPKGIPLRQGSFFGDEGMNGDPILEQAIEVVRKEGKASISMLQRRLRVGYNRAARLIDTLEEQGIVAASQPGMQVREVLDYGEASDDAPGEEEDPA